MAFSRITKALAIPSGATATYTFFGLHSDLDTAPTLTCRHAGDGTPSYKHARWRLFSARARQAGALTESKAAANMLENARLIADHCVVAWTGVIEDDGTVAPCSPEKVLEFLTAIIEADEGDAIYAVFQAWVQDADNFRPAVIGNAVDLGKA